MNSLFKWQLIDNWYSCHFGNIYEAIGNVWEVDEVKPFMATCYYDGHSMTKYCTSLDKGKELVEGFFLSVYLRPKIAGINETLQNLHQNAFFIKRLIEAEKGDDIAKLAVADELKENGLSEAFVEGYISRFKS